MIMGTRRQKGQLGRKDMVPIRFTACDGQCNTAYASHLCRPCPKECAAVVETRRIMAMVARMSDSGAGQLEQAFSA